LKIFKLCKEPKIFVTTALEDDISKLVDAAKKEPYYDQLSPEQGGNKIQASKSSDLANYKAKP
jgi:hypothetical protein